MANGTEIIDYKAALETALAAQYPNHNITVFKRLSEDFSLPAIVVNIPVLEPNASGGITTQKMNSLLQTNAFVLYSAADEENEIECLQRSVNLSKFINGNTWGLRITPAKVTLVEPMLVEGLEEYIMQRIDFEQNLVITENS